MSRKKRPRVAYAPQPAEDQDVPFRRIYRPKIGSNVVGIIVSETVVGVWVHWSGQHDVPHVEPVSACHLCKVGTRSLRWKGYVEVLWPVTGTCFLAELSEGAVQSCIELGTPGTPIRGRTITLRRVGKTANSRIVAEVSALGDGKNLPQPCDVRRCLEAIWFGRTRELPFDKNQGETDDESTL